MSLSHLLDTLHITHWDTIVAQTKKNALVGGFVRDGSIQKYKDLNTI